ncbi:MAG: tRNA (adenosine(37)-N6)-threonylcarbamoyltransferase complex dimerization subunit type 1 TsaB [Fusobacteriaceae bacterium]
MLVLAIDTSTKIGSVALYDDMKGILAEISLNSGNNHSENIMNSIDQLFQLTGKKTEEIDRVAVSTGPGSFTGIRIAVSVAKGLAYSLGCEIVGINELDSIANLAGSFEGEIISLIDARKERTYFAKYKKENLDLVRQSEYKDGELKDILENQKGKKTLFLGDGALNYKELIFSVMGEDANFYPDVLSLPRAGVLACLAVKKSADNLMGLEPYYVNKSQAEREKEEREKAKI